MKKSLVKLTALSLAASSVLATSPVFAAKVNFPMFDPSNPGSYNEETSYVESEKETSSVSEKTSEEIASEANRQNSEDAAGNAYTDYDESGNLNSHEYANPNAKTDPKTGKHETPAEENEVYGYLTEAAAVKAAKAALENDNLNKGYRIVQRPDNGRFFYQLTIDPVEETGVTMPANPLAPAESLFNPDNGFATKEEAIQSAKALVANSKINNDYKVAQGADGKWYIQLLINPDKKAEDTAKPESKESVKDPAKKEDKKADAAKLPETGEASSYAVFGAAVLSVLAGLGLVAPKFKKD
ncbi:DUF5633 domain-containing protein [Hutsoniella sourekii]